jgi:small conductance mechanosensitive channel
MFENFMGSIGKNMIEAETVGGAGEAVNEVVDVAVEETQHMADMFTKLGDYITGKIPTVLYAIVVFLIGMALAKTVVKILLRFMEKANVDKTIFGFLRSLVTIALYVFVVIITLTILKVPMDSIVTVIGAASLAVGLALQDSLSNLAGGFLILMTKPFKVGDFIESGDIVGTVENISILNTTILTGDNKTIHTPNGMLSNAKVTNYTEKSTRRLDLKFSVSYESDYKKAIAVIQKLVDNHPLAIKSEGLEPTIRLGEHGDSALIIYTRVWVNSDDYWTLNFDLLEQVKDAFDAQKIDIPYNHIDVHVVKD